MDAQMALNLGIPTVGWNVDSMLSLCCEYIDNQSCPDAFKDFVERAIEEDVANSTDAQ